MVAILERDAQGAVTLVRHAAKTLLMQVPPLLARDAGALYCSNVANV